MGPKQAYDSANRLVSGLIGTGSPQYVYGYDHVSNLTSITPNGATQSYSYSSTNAIDAAISDANGSPTMLAGNSYKWDGENRLVRFASSADNTGSSFTYDGLGRLVRVVDTHGGTITADHSYFWCGPMRCLAHDNTQTGSPVSTQYFDQGVIASGTSYYYVKDQLGSLMQLVTSGGSVAGQYAYDPYGNRTTVGGTVVADIGYAGYFYHAVSGLNFSLYRAYDSVHSRWLNRDPIGEQGGLNLYAYVLGTPVTFTDPLGLWNWAGAFAGMASGGVGGLVNGAVTGMLTGGPDAAIGLGVIGGLVGGIAGFINGGLTDPGTGAGMVGGGTAGMAAGLAGGYAGMVGGFVGGALAAATGTGNPVVGGAVGALAGAVGGAIAGAGDPFVGPAIGAVAGFISGFAGGWTAAKLAPCHYWRNH